MGELRLCSEPMTEEERRSVSSYRYEGEYAIYDLPPYERQKTERTGLSDPARWGEYHACYLGEELIGYLHIQMGPGTVEMGIGLSPARCGQGLGVRVMKQSVEWIRERAPEAEIGLMVRTWNRRAIRCYEKAGFSIIGEPFQRETPAGAGEFCRMVYQDTWRERPEGI